MIKKEVYPKENIKARLNTEGEKYKGGQNEE